MEKLNKTENSTLNLKIYDNFKSEIKIYIFIREKLVQKLHFFVANINTTLGLKEIHEER